MRTQPIARAASALSFSFFFFVAIAAADTIYPPGTYFTLAPDGESYNGTAIPIGGTNPIPIGATLTGTFSPTSISISGAAVSIMPDFTASFSASPNLVDGDNAVIYATDSSNPASMYAVGVITWDVIFPGNAGQFDIANLTGPNSLPPDFQIGTLVNLGDLTLTVSFTPSSTIPEPRTWTTLLGGLVCFLLVRRKSLFRRRGASFRPGSAMAAGAIAFVWICSAQSADAQVRLSTGTVPSSGVAGVTSVSVLGSGFPSGTITPANITVTLSTSCGGTVAATSVGTSIGTILSSTRRIAFEVPGGIPRATYFVTIADTAPGDANFTTIAGSCAAIQVTPSAPILNACVAGSSMGVLLPPDDNTGNVTAYVPKGYWFGSTTGVFVQNIEGTIGSSATIATPSVANSCAANPATGQTVCVGNNKDVYLITGTTLNTTLTSSSDTFASFSGGECNNCGVAINAANNSAVINMGKTGGSSGDGVQILDLNTNTFHPAFPMNQLVTENLSVDPTRSLILSANEGENYVLLQIQSDGSLKEYDSSFRSGLEDDSSAEDCSTGIAIAPGEGSDSFQMVNLNNITFGTTTYTAPNAVVSLASGLRNYGFSAGLSGSAVAQGSGHLAVVTGEFGGNTFAVLQLPATPGTGAPAITDYAVAAIPSNAACGGAFSAGFDPHTITAYTSPNTGDAYAVFAGYGGPLDDPICLAVVDMSVVIDATRAPRGGSGFGSHEIAPADLPASAIRFFPL